MAATLGWQTYGDTIKQMIAVNAPELGWSPEVRQVIVNSIQQLGWSKPAEPERTALPVPSPDASQPAAVAQNAQDAGAPKPAAGQGPSSEQVQQIATDLAALKQAVEQLSANQDQMAQDIAKLQATDQEVLSKVSANRLPPNKISPSSPPAVTPPAPPHKRPPAVPAASAPPPLPPR